MNRSHGSPLFRRLNFTPQRIAWCLLAGALLWMFGLIGAAISHRPSVAERRVLASELSRRNGRLYLHDETNAFTGVMVLPSRHGKTAQAVSVTSGRVSGCLERCAPPPRDYGRRRQDARAPSHGFGKR